MNQADPICAEHVGYFEQRTKMMEIGAGRSIGRPATQSALGDVIMNAFGKESEPLHFLPSARLTVNSSPSPEFKTAPWDSSVVGAGFALAVE